jgi:exopolysaccharide production protein ExoQ
LQNRKTDLIPILCFGVLPITATLAQKGIVILLVALAIFAAFGVLRQRPLSVMVPKQIAVFAVLALGWMVYRSIDTFDGNSSLWRLGHIFLLLALAFPIIWMVRGFATDVRDKVFNALVIGTAVSLVVILIGCVANYLHADYFVQLQRSDKLSIFSSGLVVIALLAPSMLAYLCGKRRFLAAAAIAGSTLALSIVSGSNAAVLATVLSLMASPLLWALPRLMPRLIIAGLMAGTLLMPVAVGLMVKEFDTGANPDIETTRKTDPDGFAGSLGHRYYIWKFTVGKAMERPWLGWGFDTSRSVPGGHKTIAVGKELMPLHPHNASLQLWLELGLPGLLIWAAMYWFVSRIRQADASSVAGWGLAEKTANLVLPMTLIGFFASSNTTYGIWQSWWFATLVLIVSVLFLWEKPMADQKSHEQS